MEATEQVGRHLAEKSESVREEIVGIAIYLLELADNLGIDLSAG